MALFDGTARRLAERPAVLFPGDPGDALADLLRRYDPAPRAARDRLVFGNGVLLHGPVRITPDIERKAKLPPGMAVAYYTGVGAGARERRPDDAIWQEGERLVHGLAARLGGTVPGQRPTVKLNLEATVYSAVPLETGQVMGVLQPHVDTGALVVDDNADVPGSYALATEDPPAFFVVYWPPRVSRSRLGRPPPALGGRLGPQPCRWLLGTRYSVADAPPDICRKVAEAALALARASDGIVIDAYGFPADRPEDLLPGRLPE
jgi:hypothetical protein